MISSVPPSTQRTGDSIEARDLEGLVVDWLTDPAKPDGIRLDGPEAPVTPLTTILGMVVTSSLPLPASAATTLGLQPGVTLGEAAAELLLAVNDPAGPRCRSYRAAVYYLHDLHGLSAVLADL